MYLVPGGCTWSGGCTWPWGGVPGPRWGGVPGSGVVYPVWGCTWSRGAVPGPGWGVPGPGGVSGTPPCEQNDKQVQKYYLAPNFVLRAVKIASVSVTVETVPACALKTIDLCNKSETRTNLLNFNKTEKKSKSDALKLPVKEVNNILYHYMYQYPCIIDKHSLFSEYILFAVLSFFLTISIPNQLMSPTSMILILYQSLSSKKSFSIYLN